jgi:chaperonin cofactor prefoldin
MSDMKRLLEKMTQFAGQAVGQKPGDQVRGTEKATKRKDNKHPFAGRLVGASESKSLLADLEKELVDGAVKRSLAEQFAEFKETKVAYDKQTGQMGANNTDPDQRHGLYINGKLIKTVDGADAANNLKKRDPRFKDATVKKIAESSLNEFAPGNGDNNGRWYTDDQITDIVGDGWWQDLDLSGANIGTIDSDVPKEHLIREAQAWLDDQGYNVQVLNVNVNDDDCDWYIEGDFGNPNFASKGMHEGEDDMFADRQSQKIGQAIIKAGKGVIEDAPHMWPDDKEMIEFTIIDGKDMIKIGKTFIEQGMSAGEDAFWDVDTAVRDQMYDAVLDIGIDLNDVLLDEQQDVAEGSNVDSQIKRIKDRILQLKDWNTTGSHDKKIKELQTRLKELRSQKQSVAEEMTPAGEFLNKQERLKAGDKVYYKGRVVGIATGDMDDDRVVFKPVHGYGTNPNFASLPIDLISLRENNQFSDLEIAIMEGGNSLEELDESRLIHSDSKVNIFYKPGHNQTKAQMVARMVPNSQVDRIIASLVNKFGVKSTDFEWHPGDRDQYKFTNEDAESFGYKSLHPEIFKARQQFPMAKSDMEALLMYVQSQEKQDIDRVDRVNDREDAEINQLDKEEDSLERRLDALTAQLEKLKTKAKTVKEEVPAPVATAGGPAGANQPKTTPPGATPAVDPAQQALQKQNQAKLQQNLANLKSAGVQIDPAKAAQTLQKTDTGAPMNAMDKDTIAQMAPAIGNVMANPQTATQLNTLIKKAGGGV